VVTGDVDDMDFVPVQNQEIGIVATDSAHSRLALLAQSAHQNAALVARGAAADRSPPMQALGMLEGHVTQQQPEHMHVITLSKEAMEHLQAHHGPPRPVQQLQVVHGPVQHLAVTQGPVSRGPHGQTSELISSHHIQGQTFQIQAGSVSYLYSTGQES